MNNIQIFKYENNDVRTVEMNGEPWFVLKDVCKVLGISKYRDAAERLDDDERAPVRVDTLGGAQEMTAVNESGLSTSSCAATSRRPNPSASGSPVKSCPVSAKTVVTSPGRNSLPHPN